MINDFYLYLQGIIDFRLFRSLHWNLQVETAQIPISAWANHTP